MWSYAISSTGSFTGEETTVFSCGTTSGTYCDSSLSSGVNISITPTKGRYIRWYLGSSDQTCCGGAFFIQFLVGFGDQCSCLPGYVRMINNSDVCTPCSAGQAVGYSIDTGINTTASICLNCSAGTYSSSEASWTCFTCAEGSYSSENSATACIACGAGMYQTGTGMTIYNCTGCYQGKYQPSIKASACIQCPSNTTSLSPRSTSVLNCLCLAGNICKYTKNIRATIRLNSTNIAVFNATQKSAFTQTVANAAGVLQALVNIEKITAK